MVAKKPKHASSGDRMLAVLGLWAIDRLQIREFPRLVLPSVTVATAFVHWIV